MLLTLRKSKAFRNFLSFVINIYYFKLLILSLRHLHDLLVNSQSKKYEHHKGILLHSKQIPRRRSFL